MRLPSLSLAALAFGVVALLGTAEAKPRASRKPTAAKRTAKKVVMPRKPAAKRSTSRTKGRRAPGAQARVSYAMGGVLRQTREVQGRRPEPLTAEESAAAAIEKLIRGPWLRRGITGLYVADAKTGEPLFAVNADDPLNPASNVKLISTATALELLGADFKYPTRVLGPAPVRGVVKGDVYLLGSYDPTLTANDMHEIAAAMANAGITSIEGSITVGPNPTRDGIYRALVPIEITAGEPGQPPTATLPANFGLIEVDVVATTSKKAHRPRLTYKTELTRTEQGYPRIALTIGGTLGKGGATMYPLWTKQRTATATYALLAALKAHAIDITGEMKVAELGDFVSDAVLRGALPVELARHESKPLAEIVARVNKWSVNWLADRVVMTAAALARSEQPSMQLALDAMYNWLARHPRIQKGLVLDTGSGLSYNTQISSQDLVKVVRHAAGFAGDADPELAQAWLGSLAIGGSDGTLRSRFRGTSVQGHILGKTGTLSRAIALAGILAVDPTRPLAFALVTNTDAPLNKRHVRKAHEEVIREISKYLATTATVETSAPPHVEMPAEGIVDETDIELEVWEPDRALDAETARSQ